MNQSKYMIFGYVWSRVCYVWSRVCYVAGKTDPRIDRCAYMSVQTYILWQEMAHINKYKYRLPCFPFF